MLDVVNRELGELREHLPFPLKLFEKNYNFEIFGFENF